MKVSRRHATLYNMLGSVSNTLVVSIQAVILIPLYLHIVGPRLYGAWLGSGDILVWMQAFDLGLPNILIQRIGTAHGKGDSKAVGEYFASGIVMLGVVALAVAAVGLAISIWLPGWMKLTGTEASLLASCFRVGVVASACIIFNNSVVGFARGVQNTALVNAVVTLSGVVGFCVSLYLLLTGRGLWSIALGIVARAGVLLAGSALVTATALRNGLAKSFRIRKHIVKEIAILSPATALGGISYAMMNQSEGALVAFFLRPELVPVLTLTRKGAEVARALLDSISYSSYGGFAHLLGSSERRRALCVHAEISAVRLSLSIAAAAAYMLVNASLVTVWVGKSNYGGSLLTVLMGTQMIVVGGAYLMNSLFRATGRVMEGSVMLAAESAIRVPLMIGLLRWFGLPGLPAAGIITSAIAGIVAYKWTVRDICSFADKGPRLGARVFAARLLVFGVGVFGCLLFYRPSWAVVVPAAILAFTISGLLLLYVDPLLRTVRAPITKLASRLAVGMRTKRAASAD